MGPSDTMPGGSGNTGDESSGGGLWSTMGGSGGTTESNNNNNNNTEFSGGGAAAAALGQGPVQAFVQSPPPVITTTPDAYSPHRRTVAQEGYISQFAAASTPQQQQQQQQSSPSAFYGGSPSGGANAATGSSSSFAARSQQQQQQHAYYGGGNSSTAAEFHTPSFNGVGGGGGGDPLHLARSQPAYGLPLQQQPPYQQQPPNNRTMTGGGVPPPISSSGAPVPVVAPGSYAARSAAATLYGSGGTSSVSSSSHQNNQLTSSSQQQQYQPNSSQQQQHNQQQSVYGSNNSSGNSVLLQRAQQQQQQQQYQQQQPPQQSGRHSGAPPMIVGVESAQNQQKILTEATRKVQEHAYYMKQAMDQPNLAVTLDRAAHMVGELGGPPHGGGGGSPSGSGGSGGAPTNTGGSSKLTPRNYYELYMRALEDMPALEEYLLQLASSSSSSISQADASLSPSPGMIRIVEHASQLETPRQQQQLHYTMRQLYDCVQYCPRVVSRLYLQIAAGSALIRSGECGAKWVMHDLQEAVKCEQNPVRGLFMRNFLLTALRDKLPDTPPISNTRPQDATVAVEGQQPDTDAPKNDDDDSAADYDVDLQSSRKPNDEEDVGTVKDSYEFILANFMEMNKLWVRIQHLPGEGHNKDVKKRRERERNDLRILVGTNLVRLSQLECVTSKIYGENILPRILEHIVTTGDPLSQAYLMDCLVQVFPDEYHIETLPILLNVCPRLRDKVNVRTILQGLMDRLANYLAEEELLDENDTNQVKKVSTGDSFILFDECVQKVYNARGPRLTSKEVIRLQTALLQFSIKCFPGNMDQVKHCINACVTALRQANMSYEAVANGTAGNNGSEAAMNVLDDAAIVELEKLLSIPLDSLALRVLELDQYSLLISFLPWENRREVAISMLRAVDKVGPVPMNIPDAEQLFRVIEPLLRDERAAYLGNTAGTMNGPTILHPHQQPIPGVGGAFGFPGDPVRWTKIQHENSHVSKLIHLMHHEDTHIAFGLLEVARNRITQPGSDPDRFGYTLVAVVYCALKLANRVFNATSQAKDQINIVNKVEKKAMPPQALEKNDDDSTVDEFPSNVQLESTFPTVNVEESLSR